MPCGVVYSLKPMNVLCIGARFPFRVTGSRFGILFVLVFVLSLSLFSSLSFKLSLVLLMVGVADGGNRRRNRCNSSLHVSDSRRIAVVDLSP